MRWETEKKWERRIVQENEQGGGVGEEDRETEMAGGKGPSTLFIL